MGPPASGQQTIPVSLKHYKCICDEINTLEGAGIIKKLQPMGQSYSRCYMKTQLGQLPQRCLCLDYICINELVPKSTMNKGKELGVISPYSLLQVE